MEEINVNDILNIFRGKILLIIVIISLVTTAGMMYVLFFKTPLYMSETTMVLTAPTNATVKSGNTDSITQTDILLNQKLVSTYSEIIKSKKVVNKVISNLKLNNSTEEVIKMITVSSKKDTEMLQIKVLNADPIVASKIANQISEVFGKEIVDIYNIQNVSIIDRAEVSKVPSNINIIKEVIMFVGIGIVLAFGISFLIYLLDTTIKTPEEVESKLGLPILTVIPIQKR